MHHVPPQWLRRALFPVWLVLAAVVAALVAVTVVVALVAAPFTRRRRVLRLALFGLTYARMELVVLPTAVALWVKWRVLPRRRAQRDEWLAANEALLRWALESVLGVAHQSLGFRTELDRRSQSDALRDDLPALVLSRHGGPGDSFALVQLLLDHGRHVRIVLKDILQLDPALDLVLNRLDCLFLASPNGSGGRSAEDVGALAAALGPRDVLLLFPEGGNWTPRRRTRAIRHLHTVGETEAAHAGELMEHVLPPRPGGVLAAIDARPDGAVLMVAHAGLDDITSARDAWDSLPVTTPMVVRYWRASTPPAEPDDRVKWLTAEWAIVDEWIDAFHAGALQGHPGQPDRR